jgi:hypothetical protein
MRSVTLTGSEASCGTGELAAGPAALATNGVATAVPAAAMKARRLNPDVGELMSSVMNGLHR